MYNGFDSYGGYGGFGESGGGSGSSGGSFGGSDLDFGGARKSSLPKEWDVFPKGYEYFSDWEKKYPHFSNLARDPYYQEFHKAQAERFGLDARQYLNSYTGEIARRYPGKSPLQLGRFLTKSFQKFLPEMSTMGGSIGDAFERAEERVKEKGWKTWTESLPTAKDLGMTESEFAKLKDNFEPSFYYDFTRPGGNWKIGDFAKWERQIDELEKKTSSKDPQCKMIKELDRWADEVERQARLNQQTMKYPSPTPGPTPSNKPRFRQAEEHPATPETTVYPTPAPPAPKRRLTEEEEKRVIDAIKIIKGIDLKTGNEIEQALSGNRIGVDSSLPGRNRSGETEENTFLNPYRTFTIKPELVEKSKKYFEAGKLRALLELAATLIHENTHANGGNEREAYSNEIDFLSRVLHKLNERLQKEDFRYEDSFNLGQKIEATKECLKGSINTARNVDPYFKKIYNEQDLKSKRLGR